MTGPAVEEYEHDGVWVTHARPVGAPAGRPPLVFVHGGAHASWCWEFLLPALAGRGWECLALDWFDHGRSRRTDRETFLRRGIADVTTEIGIVARLAGRPTVLVGHSMGAAACLRHAADADTDAGVAGLVLLTPVLPAGIGAQPVPIPVDPSEPMPPFPLPVARELFFTSLDEPAARRYAALLCAESPQAVLDATRWRVEVDLAAISAPALVVAGGRDRLCPHPSVGELASRLGAGYVLLDSAGHDDVLLHDGTWQAVAVRIDEWLAATV